MYYRVLITLIIIAVYRFWVTIVVILPIVTEALFPVITVASLITVNYFPIIIAADIVVVFPIINYFLVTTAAVRRLVTIAVVYLNIVIELLVAALRNVRFNYINVFIIALLNLVISVVAYSRLKINNL